mmetsp:Transcript_20287/g.38590  ORF Transcript_20287/g.38590 Transcript_20287/m.38590 type:complete len:250 (+) Transcript_20287:2631-3380(+)
MPRVLVLTRLVFLSSSVKNTPHTPLSITYMYSVSVSPCLMISVPVAAVCLNMLPMSVSNTCSSMSSNNKQSSMALHSICRVSSDLACSTICTCSTPSPPTAMRFSRARRGGVLAIESVRDTSGLEPPLWFLAVPLWLWPGIPATECWASSMHSLNASHTAPSIISGNPLLAAAAGTPASLLCTLSAWVLSSSSISAATSATSRCMGWERSTRKLRLGAPSSLHTLASRRTHPSPYACSAACRRCMSAAS